MGKALYLHHLLVTGSIWVDSLLAFLLFPFVFLGHPVPVRLLFGSDGVPGVPEGPVLRLYTALCSLKDDYSSQLLQPGALWNETSLPKGNEFEQVLLPMSRDEDSNYVTFPYYFGLDPLVDVESESLREADHCAKSLQTTYSGEWQSMGDDSTIKPDPSRHVDYFSHKWREEDLWTSWKHLASKRSQMQNQDRLENAIWRTWAQVKNDLGTVAPGELRWYVVKENSSSSGSNVLYRMKDHDVTWLYGPFQTDPQRLRERDKKRKDTGLADSNMPAPDKSLLKQKSQLAIMQQRSMLSAEIWKENSNASKLEQQSEERRPLGLDTPNLQYHRFPSSLSSSTDDPPAGISLHSSEPNSVLASETDGPSSDVAERHVSFNEKVEQCISLDKGKTKLVYDSLPFRIEKIASNEIQMTEEPQRGDQVQSKIRTIARLPPASLKQAEDDLGCFGETQAYQSSERLFPIFPLEKLQHAATLDQGPTHLELDDADTDLDWKGPLPSRQILATRSGSELSPKEDCPISWYDKDMHGEEDCMRKSALELVRVDEIALCREVDEEKESASLLGRVARKINIARDIAFVLWAGGRKHV